MKLAVPCTETAGADTMREALLATYARGRRLMPEIPPLQGDLFQWEAPARVEETDARRSSQGVIPVAEWVQPADPEPGTAECGVFHR